MEIAAGTPINPIQHDALLALEGLGYSKTEAAGIIRKIPFDEKMTLEELIKKALTGKVSDSK